MRMVMTVAAVVVVLVGCGSDMPPVERAPAPAPGYVAVVAARTTQTFTATLAGTVRDVGVRSGQRVHRGDVLVIQDTALLAQQLKQARAEVAAARAIVGDANDLLTAARHSLAAERKLVQVGYGSQSTVHEQQLEVSKAESEVRAQQRIVDARTARAEALTLELEHATMTAPFDGMIGSVVVTPGDAVAQGATLVTMVDPDALVVQFAIPASTPIAIGQKVELAVPDAQPTTVAITRVRDLTASFRIVEADLAAPAASLKLSSVGRVTVAAVDLPNRPVR